MRATTSTVAAKNRLSSAGLNPIAPTRIAGAAPKKFLRLGLPDTYVGQVGTHEWLLDRYGLSTRRLVQRIGRFLA